MATGWIRKSNFIFVKMLKGYVSHADAGTFR